MKISLISLIASVSAATTATTGGSGTTTKQWKWEVCLKPTDCKENWVCCQVTKNSNGEAVTPENICTDPS